MLAVIRVRGSIGVKKEILYTLELLKLNKPNHLVLIPKRKELEKMVKKVESFITYGEISEEVLEKLLEKRGKTKGNKKLNKEFLNKTKKKSLKEIAKELIEGKTSMKELGIKRVFRLRPPRKGFERAGIKKGYSVGGALGYRAADINELILKMI